MKVYNEIVFDVDGNVTHEDSYEYSGDVMLCLKDWDGDGIITVTDIVLATAAGATMGEIAELTANIGVDITTSDEYGDWVSGVQAQTRDVQLNPMHSTSISNVGTSPFTGTVSTIPGGFQPLPQVAGGRKKLYQLSKFHGGLNQKSSPRDISDEECREAENVTVSNIGRIKLLGDCLNTDNSITVNGDAVAGRCRPGYGLFQFTAPADTNGTIGEQVITLTADGQSIDSYDSTVGATDDWMNFSTTNTNTVAPIFYASGNGVYAADAVHLSTSNIPIAKIWVYREDAGSNTVSGWVEGAPLINSPTYDSDADADMVAGTVKCTHNGGDATPHGSSTLGHGTVIADCRPTGAGDWDGTYYFYISWLFDGGCETGLTSFADDGGDDAASNGIAFVAASSGTLSFNLSINHSNASPLGGYKRIEGGRIYFKKSGTAERWELATFTMKDGVRSALASTFIPWDESSDIYSLSSDIVFDSPPEIYSYLANNGYYANEVYTESPDSIASTTAGATPHVVNYRAVTVGSGGIVFIGNVKFREEHFPDSMMYSIEGRPGIFPQKNKFDSISSDGSMITALASYKDTILQFKSDGLYVVNVSNPETFYVQASFRNCGVKNPCQVFTTSFGVIFVNKFGCYIYDGQKVVSLTDGKFDWINQSGIIENISNVSTAKLPCVGYDPRSQSIIVLKNIGDDGVLNSAWVYNMVTRSWTEGISMITNGDGRRHTNFIITSELSTNDTGYLSILRDNVDTLLNYNHDKTDDTGDQTIKYITKDIDFGLPSQTKKVFKVYVTYFSDNATVPTMTFGIDGDTTPTEAFDSGGFASSGGLQTTAWTVNDGALTGIKSLALKITGSTDHSFEINDISILYRVRPIK